MTEYQNDYIEFDKIPEEETMNAFRVTIMTNDHFIDGDLILPENIRFRNSCPDSMLFYFLNGGFQFVTLKNCEIRDRKNIAFRPDVCQVLHVRVAAIVTIQVVDDSGFEPKPLRINSIEIDNTRPERTKRKRRTGKNHR